MLIISFLVKYFCLEFILKLTDHFFPSKCITYHTTIDEIPYEGFFEKKEPTSREEKVEINHNELNNRVRKKY